MFTCILDSLIGNKQTPQGVRTFERSVASKLNAKGYGVFTTPNTFVGSPKVHNLKKINFCFFEIDDIPKDEQLEKIELSTSLTGVGPTLIIESKNSFHVYYKIFDNCSIEDFNLIQKGLIKYFNSDKKITNVNRLMRVDGFFHLKNPKDPFLVQRFSSNPSRSYRVEELRKAFPYTPPPKKTYMPNLASVECSDLNDFLKNSHNLNNLQKLSGTQFVNFETYTFQKQSNNTVSIKVDGKRTSCFIDSQGLIGASYGPNIWQWLRYFGHSDKNIRRIINEVFDV